MPWELTAGDCREGRWSGARCRGAMDAARQGRRGAVSGRSSAVLRHSYCSAAPSLRFVVVAVTQVAYEVEGWGVGELVVADDRVVWHELPWPRASGSQDPSQPPTHPGLGHVVPRKPSRRSNSFVSEVMQLLQAYFAGERVPLEEVPVELAYETSFFERCATALRRIPRGETVS